MVDGKGYILGKDGGTAVAEDAEDGMTSGSERLRRDLRDLGFASSAIDAVWPGWWTEDADSSISAATELRFTVARRLGLSPQSLLEASPEFVWRDEAKYKNLGTASKRDLAILSSFGLAAARCAMEAVDDAYAISPVSAPELRASILETSQFVDLRDLLALSWGIGVPVFYLTVFPLGKKRMHAMSVRSGDRYAILLGRVSRFPAQVAYLVAHEIAHIMLSHVTEKRALLEVEDPLAQANADHEEAQADAYALALLTGDEAPRVVSSHESFSATQLAYAAQEAAGQRRVDPGILALCLGHGSGQWQQVFGALKIIPPGEVNVAPMINQLALGQFEWGRLSLSSREYLATLLGVEGGC